MKTLENETSLSVSQLYVVCISAPSTTQQELRRIIAGCREAKRKFLFVTEMGEEESERRVLVRMVSYLALGGAQI